jgi:hypothetical protein
VSDKAADESSEPDEDALQQFTETEKQAADGAQEPAQDAHRTVPAAGSLARAQRLTFIGVCMSFNYPQVAFVITMDGGSP